MVSSAIAVGSGAGADLLANVVALLEPQIIAPEGLRLRRNAPTVPVYRFAP